MFINDFVYYSSGVRFNHSQHLFTLPAVCVRYCWISSSSFKIVFFFKIATHLLQLLLWHGEYIYVCVYVCIVCVCMCASIGYFHGFHENLLKLLNVLGFFVFFFKFFANLSIASVLIAYISLSSSTSGWFVYTFLQRIIIFL